jgi:hypothetical protein
VAPRPVKPKPKPEKPKPKPKPQPPLSPPVPEYDEPEEDTTPLPPAPPEPSDSGQDEDVQPPPPPPLVKPKPRPKPKPKPVPKPKPQPTITTTIDPQKRSLVESAYAQALAYAIDSFAQNKGQKLTSVQAYDLVVVPFRRATVLAPGAEAVPTPAEIKNFSTFWANPVSTIRTAMQAALKAAQDEIDFKVSNNVLALTPDKKHYLLVPPSKTRGTATDPKTGKTLPIAA